MKRPFVSTEAEARRKIALAGPVSKHPYHTTFIQFGLLNDPRWQANIEDKQSRFQ